MTTDNLLRFGVIVLCLVPLTPFMLWQIRYARLANELIFYMKEKYSSLWEEMMENKIGYTFLRFSSRTSGYPRGPYAQLRAIAYVENLKIEDKKIEDLLLEMKATIKKAILLTKILSALIGVIFIIGLFYIYIR